MTQGYMSTGTSTTIRSAEFAFWIDGRIRENIEAALKQISRATVKSLPKSRPYRIAGRYSCLSGGSERLPTRRLSETISANY